MKKTKHPIVRIDSDAMDDLDKRANDPHKKISKARFASDAIKEKISRERKERTEIIVGEIFEHYNEKSDYYYKKGIKNTDEFFAELVLNKDVLKIGKAQKKLEKENQKKIDRLEELERKQNQMQEQLNSFGELNHDLPMTLRKDPKTGKMNVESVNVDMDMFRAGGNEERAEILRKQREN